MKITIKYDPNNGYVFPDGKAQDWVKKTVANFNDIPTEENLEWNITVCSELLIDMFRLEIAKGNIDHKIVKFGYKGSEIDVDKFGTLIEWPEGFCNTVEKILVQLLTRSKSMEG